MNMKIKKGNKYKCFKSFVLGGATIFTESEEYYASNDNELICNDGGVYEIKYDSFILDHFWERPTEEEYEKALKTIRAYHPDRFVKLKEVPMKNGTMDDAWAYVAIIDGFFNLVTSNGEIVIANTKLSITDNVDEPMTATATFLVKMGEIVNEQ